MLLSFILIAIIAFGGLALTYLVAEDKSLMWRLAAGNIVGCTILGLALFVLGSVAGFSVGTVAASLVLTLAPAALLLRIDVRSRLNRDLNKAKGKLQGANSKKLLRFAYYGGFFLLFWAFFSQAVYILKDGIYTGGTQNLGDLPFHLGAIFSFTDGANFPVQNPSWAGAKFSYPFISDLITAGLVKLGAGFDSAIVLQDVSWTLSLLIILEEFCFRLTGSRLAARIGPVLLFLSGGLGFLVFFKDLGESSKGLFDLLWNLPHDYTINDNFRWGNSLVVLFMTQRSLLLGMPLTVLVLAYLWRVFALDRPAEGKHDSAGVPGAFSYSGFPLAALLMGLLAGTLPLVHLHSLVTLFVVTGFLFIFKPGEWKTWIAFGIGTAVIAVPELIWSMTGSATDTSKFFGWHLGWDKRETDIGWFWFTNTGLLLPLLVLGLVLLYRHWSASTKADIHESAKRAIKGEGLPALLENARPLLLFYVPFFVLFVVCNIAKFAPWEWDNIKILIYWYIGSIPIVAVVLAWMWQKSRGYAITAAACLAVLTFAGALDVWRTMSHQIKMRIFDTDAIAVAEQIKQKTDAHALFLNAPTYNSAVVLSGRPSLMRYSGHLSSYGIDYLPRENDVKRIYEGGGVSDVLLKKYNIDYILISPEERNTLKANEEFFRKYPVTAESGQYRVYKVR